jgi:hypothetical protein
MAGSELLYHTPSRVFYERVRNWRLIGENVGAGGSVSSLHEAFMASPDHRAIILHPSARVRRGGRETRRRADVGDGHLCEGRQSRLPSARADLLTARIPLQAHTHARPSPS